MKYSLLSAALIIGFVQTVSAHSASSAQSLDIRAPAEKSSLCHEVEPEKLTAIYKISQGNGSDNAEHTLQLTRYQDQVIYQKSSQTFEAWNKNGEYTRYFPADKRSVSYRRGDLLSLNINYDLEQLFHLVSPKVQSQLTQSKTAQQGCMAVTHFSGAQAGNDVDLQWVTSLKLPYQLTIGAGEQQIKYQLTEVKPVAQVDFKALISGYKDIDFADVGDSESDPFIAKMITQGFIQHGSSGFYDSQGNQLSGGAHGGHSH